MPMSYTRQLLYSVFPTAVAAVITAVLATPAYAVTTVINPGGGPLEPANHHSWLVTDSGPNIRDDEFANMVFQGTAMGQTPHSAMLFTMGQCFSGGFQNDLATAVGGGSIGFTAAARWDQCSWSNTNTGNTFLQPWGSAVGAPHPNNDQFLQAYNSAVANDPNSGITFPQYYAVDADTQTLNLGGGNNNFAVLFVGDTNGRPDFFLDINQIHSVLTTDYGFDEAHIFALYGDGVRRDSGDLTSALLPAWIDSAGTRAQLSTALAGVSGAWVPNDGFFFWSSNHGAESVVPLPAAVWLFGSGLLGLIGIARRKRRSA